MVQIVYDRLEVMLGMQSDLNDQTNGAKWRDGVTSKNRVINWERCIRQEGSEFIDSFPWKHWKSIESKADLENARIELIDIWHFYMALHLTKYRDLDIPNSTNILYDNFAAAMPEFDRDPVEVMEELIQATHMGNMNVKLRVILIHFHTLMGLVDMSMDDLYFMYMSKNILNSFRQENGYAEGTYVKIWDGKEDNVVLMSILRKNPTYGPKELKEKLAEEYSKISK